MKAIILLMIFLKSTVNVDISLVSFFWLLLVFIIIVGLFVGVMRFFHHIDTKNNE